MRIEWGDNIKKLSYSEFSKQMKDIYKDIPYDEREIKMKELYFTATGKSPHDVVKKEAKKEETE